MVSYQLDSARRRMSIQYFLNSKINVLTRCDPAKTSALPAETKCKNATQCDPLTANQNINDMQYTIQSTAGMTYFCRPEHRNELAF